MEERLNQLINELSMFIEAEACRKANELKDAGNHFAFLDRLNQLKNKSNESK